MIIFNIALYFGLILGSVLCGDLKLETLHKDLTSNVKILKELKEVGK